MLSSSLPQLLAFGWASSPQRLAAAGMVTVGFAAVARVLRGVTRSGALGGGLACFLLFAAAGPPEFTVLAVLFVITWAATRFGYRRKLQLGLAEPREGRNAWQVLANLGVAAASCVIFAVTGNAAWLMAASAAFAEAATDTVASEIGQYRTQDALLITTWQHVPAGTDGGITISGSVAGLAAGIIISLVSALTGTIPVHRLWLPVASGFAGMLFDSILGATLQRRGWINNQAVNLFGTLAAATLAFAASM